VADWAIWDAYNLSEATMVGWWEKQTTLPVRVVAPVGANATTVAACSTTAARTGNVLATAYVLVGVRTLVSVASWANETVACELEVDWSALELSAPTHVQAAAVEGFQAAASFAVENGRVKGMSTAAARGWLITLGTPPPPPPPPPTPPKRFGWKAVAKGAPGGGSPCLGSGPSGCIFDPQYCAQKRYGGQCAMLETEAQAKCGAWAKCDGVVCRADYDGYCLARAEMTAAAIPGFWGYRKVPQNQTVH
jgi:hypothetical protein